MVFNSKAQIERAIKKQITSNPQQAIKAMLRIYQYQSEDEKKDLQTKHSNGVGFTAADSYILSSFSRQVLGGRQLSERQLNILFSKIGKYALQLATHAIENGIYVKADGKWTPTV